MRRGFSLYESMLTILLVLLTLGILAELFSSYSQAVRTANAKNRTLVAVQVALTSVRNELREAISVETPAPSATASEIKFSRMDPASSRFPGPVPQWNPFQPAQVERLRLVVTDGQLLREVKFSDGSQGQVVLLDNVLALSCQRGAVEDFEIALTVDEDRRQRRLVTRVVGLSR